MYRLEYKIFVTEKAGTVYDDLPTLCKTRLEKMGIPYNPSDECHVLSIPLSNPNSKNKDKDASSLDLWVKGWKVLHHDEYEMELFSRTAGDQVLFGTSHLMKKILGACDVTGCVLRVEKHKSVQMLSREVVSRMIVDDVSVFYGAISAYADSSVEQSPFVGCIEIETLVAGQILPTLRAIAQRLGCKLGTPAEPARFPLSYHWFSLAKSPSISDIFFKKTKRLAMNLHPISFERKSPNSARLFFSIDTSFHLDSADAALHLFTRAIEQTKATNQMEHPEDHLRSSWVGVESSTNVPRWDVIVFDRDTKSSTARLALNSSPSFDLVVKVSYTNQTTLAETFSSFKLRAPVSFRLDDCDEIKGVLNRYFLCDFQDPNPTSRAFEVYHNASMALVAVKNLDASTKEMRFAVTVGHVCNYESPETKMVSSALEQHADSDELKLTFKPLPADATVELLEDKSRIFDFPDERGNPVVLSDTMEYRVGVNSDNPWSLRRFLVDMIVCVGQDRSDSNDGKQTVQTRLTRGMDLIHGNSFVNVWLKNVTVIAKNKPGNDYCFVISLGLLTNSAEQHTLPVEQWLQSTLKLPAVDNGSVQTRVVKHDQPRQFFDKPDLDELHQSRHVIKLCGVPTIERDAAIKWTHHAKREDKQGTGSFWEWVKHWKVPPHSISKNIKVALDKVFFNTDAEEEEENDE